MPGWVKITLVIAGIWIACYALGISPAAVIDGFFHGLQQMHNQSVNGK